MAACTYRSGWEITPVPIAEHSGYSFDLRRCSEPSEYTDDTGTAKSGTGAERGIWVPGPSNTVLGPKLYSCIEKRTNSLSTRMDGWFWLAQTLLRHLIIIVEMCVTRFEVNFFGSYSVRSWPTYTSPLLMHLHRRKHLSALLSNPEPSKSFNSEIYPLTPKVRPLIPNSRIFSMVMTS